MISFVYFDIGGTVIKDFSGTNKWEEMKRDLGVKSEDDARFNKFFDDYEKKVNRGLDVDSLIPLMTKDFDVVFSQGYSLLSDIVNRFAANPSIWPVIEKIKARCRVGLLTNMYPGMFKLIGEQGLMPPISWDVVIDSSIEKCKKPEPEIYKIAEQRCGVKPGEILFIDNMPANIQTAKSLGWQTFLYDPTNTEKSNTDLVLLFTNAK